MNLRLAIRNLMRHRLRTWLTAGGVAVAVALLIWLTGFMDAMFALMINKVTESQLGHAQIHTKAYIDEPSMYEHFEASSELVQRIEAVPDVVAVAPRAHSFGLLGHEKSSQIAMLTGIDVAREGRVTTVHRDLVQGSWLEPPAGRPEHKPLVLGVGLARQLGAKVGDELVALLQGVDGSMGNEIVVVSGIVQSGNTDLDRQVAYLRLQDMQSLMALDGHVMELALKFERDAPLHETTARVAEVLAQASTTAKGVVDAAEQPSREAPELVVRSWKEIVPELAQMIEVSQGSSVVMYFIVYLLAGLGILNTQRMSALERKREFGVMMAVGLTPRGLASTIVYETLTLVTVGGGLGAALGVAITAYFSRFGLNMSLGSGSDESLSYAGMTFDEPLMFQFAAGMFISPLVALMCVGLICALWPAISSARLEPVRAISGRT